MTFINFAQTPHSRMLNLGLGTKVLKDQGLRQCDDSTFNKCHLAKQLHF